MRIGIVAGEASGDVLAAGLIKEIKRLCPQAEFIGVAGTQMQAQGMSSLFDMEILSVMGLTEVLGRLPEIFRVKKLLLEHYKNNPIDIFIGVDAPDFNLRIEKELKSQGVPTVHYISPSIWAWRENRIHKIAKATSLVMGVFPFEQHVYDKYQVPYQFVGHTMADDIPLKPSMSEAKNVLGLEQDTPYLALLPGSRKREVESLLSDFIETFRLLRANHKTLKCVVPAVNQVRFKQITDILKDTAQDLLDTGAVTLLMGHAREAMIASEAVLIASGTASLEAMLCKKPMVVAYKMSGLTYQLMKWLYKAPYFALPNVLAGQLLVPELLQEDVNPAAMSDYLSSWLNQKPTELISQFEELHETLRLGASHTAAKAVLSLVESPC